MSTCRLFSLFSHSFSAPPCAFVVYSFPLTSLKLRSAQMAKFGGGGLRDFIGFAQCASRKFNQWAVIKMIYNILIWLNYNNPGTAQNCVLAHRALPGTPDGLPMPGCQWLSSVTVQMNAEKNIVKASVAFLSVFRLVRREQSVTLNQRSLQSQMQLISYSRRPLGQGKACC